MDRVPCLALLLGLAAVLAAAPFAVAEEPEEPAKPASGENLVADREALLEEVEPLEKEGTEWFNVAGDTDLSHEKRNAARKKAYDLLKKAYGLFDRFLERYPSEMQRFEDRMVQIHMKIYWIRKESPLGLLEPEEGDTMPFRPEGGLRNPRREPAPGQPRAGPRSPAKPKTPRDFLEEAKAYEKRHRANVAGCLARYEAFLEEHADAPPDVFREALERVAALNETLKAGYRELRDDDPDSLENVDGSRAIRLVKIHTERLRRGSPEERIEAARTLGYLGSGRAARPLLGALRREKEGAFFTEVADALSRIGGRRVCEQLAELGGDSPLAPTIVGILSTVLRRGGAEGRIAGEALATVIVSVSPDLQQVALERLHAAGPAGATGLARAIAAVPSRERVKYIEHLGKLADPRTAEQLASFLVVSARGSRKEAARAARAAIRAIGIPAVPYLIRRLDDEKVQVWTAEMLRRLTGAKPRNDRRRTWERWWRSNRRRLTGK